MQQTSRSVREIIGFEFSYLQNYAAYLLDNCFESFVKELGAAYEEIDVPLTRSFRTLNEQARLSYLSTSARELLALVASNKMGEYIDETVRNWLTRQFPFVLERDIHSEDITLVTYTREKVLRKFLPLYTNDTDLWLKLVEEINRFTAILTSEAFSLYVHLQQEEVTKINSALTKRERELLRAQEIGQSTIQKLQESEELYKQAQALTHIGNWSLNIVDKKMVWSDEMYRIYGLEPQSEEITFDRWLSFVHTDDIETRKEEIRRSLQDLHVHEYLVRINAADGTAKILKGKGEVIADVSGRPVVMRGTCQDVTNEVMLTQQLRDRERYLQELNSSLKLANQELSRSNEELESFNFIASHDLQEPLRKIQIYASRILESGIDTLPEKLQDYFGRINAASKRMQNLIDDFLAFSQTFDTSQAPELIDPNELVEEIRMELVTRIEEKGAEIYVETLPPIRAVRFQIKQLLVNLIANALKYTRFDTVPRLRISGSIILGKDMDFPEAEHEWPYVRIAVQDNGIGFDPKYRFKIFELFQRLHGKNVYSGTGIGLALCKKIVRNLGGFITADSKPDQGAVFTFYIPQKP